MLFSSRLLDRLPVQTFTSSLPQRLCGKKRSRAENMLFRVQSLFVMELQTKTDLHLLPVFLLKGQSQSLPTIDRKWITSKTWRRGRAVPAQQWEGGRRWGVGRKREGWRNWSLSGAKLLVETGVSHPAELDKWNTARHVPVQPYKISMERFFFLFCHPRQRFEVACFRSEVVSFIFGSTNAVQSFLTPLQLFIQRMHKAALRRKTLSASNVWKSSWLTKGVVAWCRFKQN